MFEGRKEDVWVGVSVDHTPGFERTLIVRALDFYRQETLLLQGDRLVKLDVPEDARLSFMHSAGVAGDTLLLELRSDLRAGERVHPKRSLLAADFAAYLKGERRFQVLFEPSETRSLAGTALTRSHVLVTVNDNVIGGLEEWKREADGRFSRRAVDAPSPGNLGVTGLHDPLRRDDPLAESYLLSYASGGCAGKRRQRILRAHKIEYGDPFLEYSKPFDNFNLGFEVGASDSAYLNALYVNGTLVNSKTASLGGTLYESGADFIGNYGTAESFEGGICCITSHDTVEWTVSDFLSYPGGETFDAVVAMGYFDYLEEPLPHLRKMIGHARGRVFASFPKRWTVRTGLRILRFRLARSVMQTRPEGVSG